MTSSSGDDDHARRRHRSSALSRKRSTSRGRNHPAESSRPRRDNRDADATDRRNTRHRSTSSNTSKGYSRRRRRSRDRSDTRSPPPRRARNHSRDRSVTPPRRHRRDDDDTHARNTASRRRDRDEDRQVQQRRRTSRSPPIRSRQPLPSQLDSFRGEANGQVGPTADGAEKEKEKINWKTTGLLAAETNTVQVGSSNEKIVLKYNEPPDARKPPASARWRLYIFKGADALGDVQLSTHSCWLVGREAAVADLLIEHPSSSKQHAVVQFRYVVKQEKEKEMGVDDFLAEFGEGTAAGGPVKEKGKVRPYLLDLESTNGTYLNGERIGDRRYVELREKDIIKFGLSEREYVLLKE